MASYKFKESTGLLHMAHSIITFIKLKEFRNVMRKTMKCALLCSSKTIFRRKKDFSHYTASRIRIMTSYF